MKKKYHDLYHEHLVEGKNKAMMELWGECDKWEFDYLVDHYPQIAEMFLEKRMAAIESKKWNNYLTDKECKTIMASMSPSAKWSIDEVRSACASLGVPDEEHPYYNCYALVVTMNMIMSDHKSSITEAFTDKTALVVFVYKQAVEKLKDQDRPNFVRPYFGLV